MVNESLENIPLLENFVRGDDRYRNSRFKLCPNIAKVSTYYEDVSADGTGRKSQNYDSRLCLCFTMCISEYTSLWESVFLHTFKLKCLLQGSWIVKQSVGKTACLVGEALDITYYASDIYIEVRCTMCSFVSIDVSNTTCKEVAF